MQYELINPSDPYTFVADNKEIAALTVFALSTMYGAKSEDGSEEIPLLFLGGSKDWYRESFGKMPDEGLKENWMAVSNALLSFMYGNFTDRKRYELALNAITDDKKREEFIAAWQDGHSSINDIGTYAHRLGKRMKEAESKRLEYK